MSLPQSGTSILFVGHVIEAHWRGMLGFSLLHHQQNSSRLVEDTHMPAVTNRLLLQTTRSREFIDITPQVAALVAASAIKNGCVVVYSKHTTGAIKITENEPLLIRDMEELLEKVAPRHNEYRHNDFKDTHRQYDRERTPQWSRPLPAPPHEHQRDHSHHRRRVAVWPLAKRVLCRA